MKYAQLAGYIEGRKDIYEKMIVDFPSNEPALKMVINELTTILFYMEQLEETQA